MILFLDDMAWRHTSFAKLLDHKGYRDGVVWCWTADEAIDALKIRAFDQIFLDHDLSEEDVMTEPGKGKVDTGMKVVDYLCQVSQYTPVTSHVILHSMNGPAASEMWLRLQDAGINATLKPFYDLIEPIVR